MPKTGPCKLCEVERELTEHHLIPRTVHSNQWFKKNFSKEEMKGRTIDVCHLCHKFIHQQWSEKKLGRQLNTLDKLMNENRIRNHIKWAKKQKV